MAHFLSLWQERTPLILAHRGASRLAPENTIAAFECARTLGVDGVELDVYLTSDGVPVVIHDEDVSRTTDGEGRVTELTASQIKTLDAGAPFDAAYAGEPVPTLEAVFATLGRSLFYNIELKPAGDRNAGMVSAVIELVRKFDLTDYVLLSSFEPYKLYVARRLAPEIPCGLLYGLLTPLTPFYLLITPHEAVNPQAALLTRQRIARAHQRGKLVVTWTVDDVALVRQLVDWDVDAVITNEPDRMLEALER
jgi:glycerophosphoryl diester phosphodiesterase